MIIVEISFTVSKQYQFCFEMPLLQVFTYKSRGLYLFPLHRCGGLAGDVVDNSVDALDLVDDAAADLVEQLVGDAGPVGGHEVLGRHSAQRKHAVVAAAIAHDADGARVGQDGEVLVHLLVFAGM